MKTARGEWRGRGRGGASKVEGRRSKVLWGGMLVVAALVTATARGETLVPLSGAHLAIDGGGAWVREGFGFGEGAGGEVREVRWEGVPERVELASVVLWNVQRPWLVKGWRREGGDVVVELAEPLSTGMGCSLTYRLGGIWCEKERNGEGRERLRVENASGRAFPGARVAVVDAGEPRAEAKAKGRLDVNPDVALSSLWMPPPPERRPAKGMDGEDMWEVDVPANGEGWSEWREGEPEGDTP